MSKGSRNGEVVLSRKYNTTEIFENMMQAGIRVGLGERGNVKQEDIGGGK